MYQRKANKSWSSNCKDDIYMDVIRTAGIPKLMTPVSSKRRRKEGQYCKSVNVFKFVIIINK